MRCDVRKLVFWISNSDRPVQFRKMLEISDLRRGIVLSEYCSENKGANQLCSYCTVVFASAKIWFSPDEALVYLGA